MDDKQGKEFGKNDMKQQRLLAVTLYKPDLFKYKYKI